MNNDNGQTQAIEVVEARAPAQIQRTPTAIGPRGMMLANLDEAFRFARAVAQSGLAPKGMNEQAILVAIEMGAELGLPPMASLQNVAVINGRPSVWGDAIPAVCMASGLFDFEAFEETLEYDDESGFAVAATCTVRRLPKGRTVTRRFTVDDAKRAKLLGKSGPWSEYQPRMLQMRARSWALRDAFPDVLRGLVADDPTSAGPMPIPTVIEQVEPEPPPSSLSSLTSKMRERSAAASPGRSEAERADASYRKAVQDATGEWPDSDDDPGPPTHEEVAARNAELEAEVSQAPAPARDELPPEREPGADEHEPPPPKATSKKSR